MCVITSREAGSTVTGGRAQVTGCAGLKATRFIWLLPNNADVPRLPRCLLTLPRCLLPGLKEDTRINASAVSNFLNATAFPDRSFTQLQNAGRLNVLTGEGATRKYPRFRVQTDTINSVLVCTQSYTAVHPPPKKNKPPTVGPPTKPYAPFSDPTNSGFFSKLFSFGARSFSIWRLNYPAGANEVGVHTVVAVVGAAPQCACCAFCGFFKAPGSPPCSSSPNCIA